MVLTSHDLSTAELDLSTSVSSVLPDTVVPDPNAYKLIPVPPNSAVREGGVLVVAEDRILLYGNNKKTKKRASEILPDHNMKAEVQWPYSEIVAWVLINRINLVDLIWPDFFFCT